MKRITWATAGQAQNASDGGIRSYDIIHAIVSRETNLETLRKMTRPIRIQRIDKETAKRVRGLIAIVAEKTLAVAEKIMYWKLRLVHRTPFMWDGRNYLIGMIPSLDFLDRFLQLEKTKRFRRNPFALERTRLRKETRGVTRNDSGNQGVQDLCELLLVDEEETHGRVQEKFICTWCSVVGDENVACYRCRKRFCRLCVNVNNDRNVPFAKAREAKRWECFVCNQTTTTMKRTPGMSASLTWGSRTRRRRRRRVGQGSRHRTSQNETTTTTTNDESETIDDEDHVERRLTTTSSIREPEGASPDMSLAMWQKKTKNKNKKRNGRKRGSNRGRNNALDLLETEE